MSDADSTRYSRSAVFPMPASPRRTRARLSPPRIAETSSSNNADSLARPFKLDVLRVEDGEVAETTTFGTDLFAVFGLPEVYPGS